MEHLNKHQLILLALLVSFITSIATGIVTVALMDQAPQSVSQTINRVVERTIQQVVSPATTTINTINTVKETVVVNEDDQVVNTIAKNSGSLVRIFRTNTDLTAGTDAMTFVGLGVVVSDDNIIATDNSLISDGGKYFTSLSDGKLRDLNILRSSSGEQIALLKINTVSTSTSALSKASLSKTDIKLGQSVVYIGGQTKNSVAVGIVSSLGTKDISTNASSSSQGSTQTIVSSIETTLPSGNLISGGPLLNLSGELVGIKGTFLDSARTDLFVPVSSIQAVLSAYQDSQKKAQ